LDDAEGSPSRYRGSMMFPFPAAQISTRHSDARAVLLPIKIQIHLRHHLSSTGYPIGQTMLVLAGEGQK
ncbi:MAG TPA: hypothetical protein VGG66_09380, partial [Rhizomicrobium sp.]